MEKPSNLNIKSWNEADRPREKLMQKGKTALSDAELIAILLGSGTKSLSAVELARQILNSVNNNLHELATLSIKDLMKFKGIGEAKAISIASALELGRRRKDATHTRKTKITSSKDAYQFMQAELMDLSHEEFWVLLLNRANQVISKKQISAGGVSGTVADPRIIFKHAIEALASGIILMHNHPSGNQTASKQDQELTRKMVASGKSLDIPVLDHIIFTNQGYYSFADEGLLT
jgi:DNA repair protein RadC